MAKAKPDQLTYGIGGQRDCRPPHRRVACSASAGVKFIHIPYKGAAQGFPDLLGGRITCSWVARNGARRKSKRGPLRAIAVTSSKRAPALPDVPTVARDLQRLRSDDVVRRARAGRARPNRSSTRLSEEIDKDPADAGRARAHGGRRRGGARPARRNSLRCSRPISPSGRRSSRNQAPKSNERRLRHSRLGSDASCRESV